MFSPAPVTTFANTFLVSHSGSGGPTLRVVGPQEARKKRPHRKSRLGCVRCKRRKVKCDERDPCRNCVKRNETCVRFRPASSNRGGRESSPLTSLPPQVAWCPLSEAECGPVNLLHMELLHHFEQHSVSTLPFQGVWPSMLQLAFQSRQHTYLVNAMLSFAAAHLDYLHPGRGQYHRAKYALLDKALHDYRESLSASITAENCDALLATANLIQFLMWCDLSFLEGQTEPDAPLDLSGDRLYFLSTGVRQIFFMAWPLFQSAQSVFTRVCQLQPCMVLEDVVEARGLNWKRYARGLIGLYDNLRYQGGRERGREGAEATPFSISTPPPHTSSHVSSETSPFSPPSFGAPGLCSASTSFPPTPSPGGSPLGSTSNPTVSSGAYLEELLPSLPSTAAPPYRVMTLYQSYKEGEAYVKSAGTRDEVLVRGAYKRLVARLAVAMAFIMDDVGACDGGCPASGVKESGYPRQQRAKIGDIMRYVTVFPMMCFGPLLALISSGDSRMLIVLYHIYRVVGMLLPGKTYWWCKRRVEAMGEAIGRELRSRGLEVCLRRRNEVV
ncbi:hypothetical protein N657DRAFT_646211 [Parathielavia appendiculata]|uniref:Zn(2)-C6 fungal-type domain-containing protein n=1 Tax=Parathielavia appendiculata TaxID=2587402 RepID=A0AAN6Z3B1_9PEZI|nr:hypothetical protein N657DRAFT_646211 [Parathielavia appendiculata]